MLRFIRVFVFFWLFFGVANTHAQTDKAPLQGYFFGLVNANCANPNGSVSVGGQGGTAPYSFQMDGVGPFFPGTPFYTFSPLAVGVHTVTIKDFTGATNTFQFTIGTDEFIAEIQSVSGVPCSGVNSGVIQAVITSGGQAPITWSINPGGVNPDGNFTGLSEGFYDITIVNGLGCITTIENIEVVVTNTFMLNVSNLDEPACFGEANASVTLNGAGGAEPYQYSIDGVNWFANNVFGGLSAGSYLFSCQGSNTCKVDLEVIIGQPDELLINNLMPVNNLCAGQSNGSVIFNVTGGVGAYTYFLDGIEENLPIDALSEGNYNLLIRDENGCEVSTDFSLLDPPELQMVLDDFANSTCNGSDDGSITVSGSGGTGAYEFKLDAGAWQNNGTFINVNPAGHTVYIRDQNGCSKSIAVPLSEPPVIIATAVLTHPDCAVASNGEINFSAIAGGNGVPYTFSVNGAPPTNVLPLTGLAPGINTIRIFDMNGCFRDFSYTLTSNSDLSIDSFNITPEDCGFSNGAVTVNASGGTPPYTYDLDGTVQVGNPVFTGLSTGNYNAVVTDALGCQSNALVATVGEAVTIVGTVTNTNSEYCGAGNGSITIEANGGTADYSFSINPDPNGVNPVGPFPLDYTFSNLPANTYSITIEDSQGCAKVVNGITILNTASPDLAIDIENDVPDYCGNSNGGFTAIGDGGNPDYVFTINPDPNGTGQIGPAASAVYTDLSAGTYSVTITDSDGCEVTTNGIIVNSSEPADLDIIVSDEFSDHCENSNGGFTATGDGGAADYIFNINPDPNAVGPVGPAASAVYTDLSAGNYSVTITDDDGCETAKNGITVASSEAADLDVLISDEFPDYCENSNGGVTASGVGGNPDYIFSINPDPNATGPLGPTASAVYTDLSAGTYALTITDSDGCELTKNGIIVTNSEPADLDVLISDKLPDYCGNSNGEFTATGVGGTADYFFSISPDPNGTGIVGPATFNVYDNLEAGTYSVTIEDASGCTTTLEDIVVTSSEPAGFEVLISGESPDYCNNWNGSFRAEGSGGTADYLFNINPDPNATGTIGPVAFVDYVDLSAGAYSITIEDSQGCAKVVNGITILNTASPDLAIDIENDVPDYCGNSNGGFTAIGDGGNPDYVFTINPDPNGTGQIGPAASAVYTDLSAGTYSVTITDSDGCITTKNGIVVTSSEPGDLNITLSNESPDFCGGSTGGFTATGAGGNPDYVFTINPDPNGTGQIGPSGSAVYTDLGAGNYVLTITDINGCETTQNVTVTADNIDPTFVFNSVTVTDASCPENSGDGSVVIVAGGGSGNYEYAIDGIPNVPVSSGTFNSLAVGEYVFTVSDANSGCQINTTQTISYSSTIALNLVAKDDVCQVGNTSGTLTVSAVPGVEPYTYSINPPVDVPNETGVFNNATAQPYVVSVTDDQGCSASLNVTINTKPLFSYAFELTDVSCNGFDNASIELWASASSGGPPTATAPYDFSINPLPAGVSNGSGNSWLFDNLPPDAYTVTMTDQEGCIRTLTPAMINEPVAIGVSVGPSNPYSLTCKGDMTELGDVLISGSGGIGPYTFSVDGGLFEAANFAGSYSLINKPAGTYVLTVKDSKGCTVDEDVVIQEPADALNAVVSVIDVECIGETDGIISVSASGGWGGYEYRLFGVNAWQPGSVFNGLAPGPYEIRVRDSESCLISIFENIIITDPLAASLSIVEEPSCAAAVNGKIQIDISQANFPIDLSIDGGAAIPINSTPYTVNNLSAGLHTFELISGNCNLILSETLTAVEDLSITYVNSTILNCPLDMDGEISFSVSGGVLPYTFDADGVPVANSPVTGLGIGVHTITVTDAANCTASFDQEIFTGSTLAGFTSSVAALCNDGFSTGSATVFATQGPAPYQFKLDGGPYLAGDPPNGTQKEFLGLTVGNYNLWIKDGNGCEIVFPITIDELSGVIFNAFVTSEPTCNGASDGIVSVNVTTGSLDFEYSTDGLAGPYVPFPPNSSGTSILGQSAGLLDIHVRDANGCIAQDNILLNEPDVLNATYVISQTTECTTSADGEVTVSVTGGTPDYKFYLNGNAIPEFTGLGPYTYSGLAVGNYTFEIEDLNDCPFNDAFELVVSDSEDPVANCNSVTLQLDAAGVANLNAADVDNNSTDNCEISSLILDISNFDCDDVGVNTVELTVEDGSGNSSTCNSVVTIEDNIDPIITACSPDKSVLAAPGDCEATGVALDDPIVTDNCVALTISNDAPVSFPVGFTTVNWTVTDGSGNVSTCSNGVTVIDNQSPSIVCPGNISVNNDADACGAVVNYVEPVGTDNCPVGTTTSQTDLTGFTTGDLFPVGVTTLEYTVTDGAALTDVCSFTVTVTDDEDPTITCAADQTQTADAGLCNAAVTVIAPTTADNCGVASVVNDFNGTADASDTYPVGTTTVTWTVTDNNGNTATCTQDITVTDDEDPTITCAAGQSQTADVGVCEAAVTVVAPVFLDNCAGSSITNDFNGTADASDTYPVGATTVVWTVTDNSGNTNFCNQVITVTDDENPVANCQPFTANLDGLGNATVIPSDVDGGSTDNCGLDNASFTVVPSAFTSADLGPNDVILTVFDMAGNSSTCTAVVTVTDLEPPVAKCKNISVGLDAAGSASIVGTDIDDGSTDNGIIVSYEANPNTFDCTNLGINQVFLTVTDDAGLTDQCESEVTIIDNIDPVAQCQNLTLQLDNSGNASIVPADIDDGSSDNCSFVPSIDMTDFTCADVGFNPVVVLSVTDPSGNSATCNATVTVEDNIDPTMTCSADQTQTADGGSCDALVTVIGPLTDDNCGVATLMNDFNGTDDASDTYPVGSTTVLWTLTDVNGNVSTCPQQITVTDDEDPTITCAADQTQTADAGLCNAAVTVIAPTTADNCGVASVMNDFNGTADASDTYPVGTTTVTWTVTDNNGNTATCTQDITVTDDEDPTITCAAGQSQTADVGVCEAAVTVVAPVFLDNCAGSSITNDFNGTADASDTYPVGATTVVWTVTDNSGNTNFCNQVITVTDDENPVANCQPFTANLDGLGNATVIPSDVDGGSTDNCGLDNASFTVVPSAFTSADLGPNDVILTVFDMAGNSSTCTAVVTVTDLEPPVAKCKNISVGLDAVGSASIVGTDIDDGSTDNGIIVSYEANPNTFDCSNTGINSVVLTVTDDAGLTGQCTSEVTINDNIDPVAQCKNLTLQLDNSGNASIVPADIDDGSSDNCSVILSIDLTDFTCADVGFNPVVVLSVTDPSGNSATCNATVTVEDNIDPTMTCSADQTQTADGGSCDALVTVIGPLTDDNCGVATLMNDFNGTDDASDTYPVGSTTVLWTLTDVNGNVSTCPQQITVTDDEDPTITCAADQTQTADAGLCNAAVTVIAPTTADNCGVASVVNDFNGTADASDTYPVGTTTVTWTVTDNNGNTATCTQDITVTDDEDPTITCAAGQSQTADVGVCEAAVTVVAPVFLDNCAGSSITNDFNGTADASDTYPVGGTAVVWTVTDNSGNTDLCTQVITVTDDENPVATCQPFTANLDGLGNATVIPSDVDGGSTDNCGLDNASFTVVPSAFTSADLGPNDVILTVFDMAGNSSTCTAVVTVTDLEPPVAKCKNISVGLDAAGSASIVGTDIDDGSTDNGIIVSYEANPNTFDCTNLGINQVFLTVTDDAGLTDQCESEVTIIDNIDPVAQCQNLTLQLDNSGNASIVPADIDDGSSDNCSVILSIDLTDFTCADVGFNPVVVLSVTDPSGNSATCNATVTVEDNIDPTMTCSADQTQTADGGSCDALVTVIGPLTDDNCGVATLMNDFNGTDDASDTYPVGSTTVLWTLTDINGNVSTCPQQIAVTDDENPIITCPPDTILNNDPGSCDAIVNELIAVATDNCDLAELIFFNDFNPGGADASDIYSVGTTEIIFTVTDVAGNFASCATVVQVIDNEVPTITCPNDTVINTDIDVCGALFTYPVPVGLDNCPASITSQTDASGLTSGDTFPVGSTTQQFSVVDAAGLDSTCAFSVTVIDEQLPDIFCTDIAVFLDEGGSIALDAIDVDAGSNDACGLDTLFLTDSIFDCMDVPSATTWLVGLDVNGNVDSCMVVVNVTVNDTIPPTMNCINIDVYLDELGEASIIPNQIDNGSVDACDIDTLYLSQYNFDCESIPLVDVWLYGKDFNGNIDSCMSVVSVIDTVKPTVVCKDIDLYLNDVGMTSITFESIDDGSTDACGLDTLVLSQSDFNCADLGFNEITLTGTDIHNNAQSCTAMVNVLDTIGPMVFCLDTTIYLDNLGSMSIDTSFINNNSIDACGIDTLFLSQFDFYCEHVGSNTDTLIAIDGSGNQSTCLAQVVVVDSILPTVFVTDTTVYLDQNGTAIIDGNWLDNESFDNCGIDTLLLSQWQFNCNDVGTLSDTLTVIDLNGNMASAVAQVTVIDTIQPAITCMDTSVFLDENGLATLTIDMVNGGAGDPCSLDTVYARKTIFSCDDIPQSFTWVIAEDINGNIDSCLAVINVYDTISPSLTCFDTTLYLNELGLVEFSITEAELMPVENCTIDTLQWEQSVFTCANIGLNPIQITAIDQSNNGGSCEMPITVADTISPFANCQDTTIYLEPDGDVEIDVSFVNNGSYDNCALSSAELSQTVFDASNIGFNNDTLILFDNYGNTSYCVAVVEVVTEMQLTVELIDTISCFGFNDGKIKINVVGGVEPYLYTFGPVIESESSEFGELYVGTYAYAVKDAFGLMVEGFYTLVEPDELKTQIFDSQPISCYGYSDGSFEILASGGTLPYAYIIDEDQIYTDPLIENLSQGNYQVQIKDKNNCLLDTSKVLSQPDSISVALEVVDTITCNGFSNGVIQLVVSGGTAPYQSVFESDTLQGDTYTYDALGAGIQSFEILDDNLCKDTNKVELKEPPPLVIELEVQDLNCFGDANGTGIVHASGGSGAFNYLWNNETNDANDTTEANLKGDSTYVVTVYDVADENCFIMGEVIPEQPEQIKFLTNPMSFSCDPNDLGVLIELQSGGVEPLEFAVGNLDTAVFTSEPYFSNLSHDLLSFSVKDASGCIEEKSEVPYNPNIPEALYEVDNDYVSILDAEVEFSDVSLNHIELIWIFGDGSSQVAGINDYLNGQYTWGPATSPTHLYRTSGLMETKLIAISSFGCADTALADVFVEEDHRIYIPNAFTPDGNGINDRFNIRGYNLNQENFSMKIYKRRGGLVFETFDLLEGWDGYDLEGNPSDAGIYVYQIFVNSGGKVIQKQGTFILIR